MRLLHVMLRVGNLQRSIKFYTQILSMDLLRIKNNTQYKYSIAFLGYNDENKGTVIELTYNWGVENYSQGTAFGHIALEVDNILITCKDMRNQGVKIIRQPNPVKGGSTMIAFLEDPDGYKIELIEKKRI